MGWKLKGPGLAVPLRAAAAGPFGGGVWPGGDEEYPGKGEPSCAGERESGSKDEFLGEGSPSVSRSVGVGGRIPGERGGIGIDSDAIRLIAGDGKDCCTYLYCIKVCRHWTPVQTGRVTSS
jgi:hypothetical protein